MIGEKLTILVILECICVHTTALSTESCMLVVYYRSNTFVTLLKGHEFHIPLVRYEERLWRN